MIENSVDLRDAGVLPDDALGRHAREIATASLRGIGGSPAT